MPIKNLTMGQNNVIADIGNVYIDNVKIGNNCNILPFVVLCPGVVLGDNVEIESFSKICEKVVIGNDVKIMSNTVIHSNVKIGDGVIIGSGSVITKDVDSWMTVFTKGKTYEKHRSRKQVKHGNN